MVDYLVSSSKFWCEIQEDFADAGGVYILKASANEGGGIGRLLGVDLEGILYIGKADSFLDRVIDLKKSLSPVHNTDSHGAGARYKDHVGIMERFPYDVLRIQLISSDTPRRLESEYLSRYLSEFGELPPLNRAQ